jgi:hypothetical protein
MTKKRNSPPGFESGPVEKRDAVFFSASGVQVKEGRAATSIRAFTMLLQVQAAGNWEEQIYI